MKLKMFAAAAFLSLFFCFEAFAQQQEQPDIYKQAEMESDRLQRMLDLEDWQAFYVDSTLMHDFPAMMAEMEEMRSAMVSNASMYTAVKDKWWDQIDNTFKKIFNEEQWAAYLKSGAAKAQKMREKRRLKASGK